MVFILLLYSEPLPAPLKSTENDSNEQIHGYAASIISFLRTELDLERRAHEQTRRHAQCRIIELEARLARREAELEAYTIQVGNSPAYSPRDSEDRKSDAPTKPRMTKEEAIKIMGTTSTRNKLLELEVQGLFKRVRS